MIQKLLILFSQVATVPTNLLYKKSYGTSERALPMSLLQNSKVQSIKEKYLLFL